MNETVTKILIFLTVLVCSAVAGLILNKVLIGKKYVSNPFAISGITVGFTLVELVLWGVCPRVLIGTMLLLILLYASCKDITCREADDWLSVMILALAVGSMTFERIGSMLLGAVVVFVPQIILAIFTKNSKLQIGGADIKISTATAFLLGFYPGAIGFMTGLFISLISQLIVSAIKKQKATEAFPLLPYLSVGLMIGYLL